MQHTLRLKSSFSSFLDIVFGVLWNLCCSSALCCGVELKWFSVVNKSYISLSLAVSSYLPTKVCSFPPVNNWEKRVLFYFQKLSSVPVTQLRRKIIASSLRFSHMIWYDYCIHQKISMNRKLRSNMSGKVVTEHSAPMISK